MIIKVISEIEAPDDATHYSGDILDNPTWWKLSVNSTGTISMWCFWKAQEKEWYVRSTHKPHWITKINKGELVIYKSSKIQSFGE